MTKKIDKNRIKLEKIEELEQELGELNELFSYVDDQTGKLEKLEKLKQNTQALKVLLIIALILLFNIGIFQLYNNWATVLVIAFFEILGILVYAKMTGNSIILDLWREIVSMVSKRKNTDEEKDADTEKGTWRKIVSMISKRKNTDEEKKRGTDDDTQKSSEKTSN